MAAIASSRNGARTLLVDPSPRLGGVCAGGLGRTDKGNAKVIGGQAQEFFLRNARHYHPEVNQTDPASDATEGGYFLEPHVAENIFTAMLQEAGVHYIKTSGVPLSSVDRQGTVITGLHLGDDTYLSGKVFIDGTYEGDLMAVSGASFTFGREASSVYKESFGGRREPFGRIDWATVSPYRPDGTLMYPLVTNEFAAPLGSGDNKVQDYNFRLCVTKNSSNKIPFPKPSNYNRSDWELLFRYAKEGECYGDTLDSYLADLLPVPNGKFDLNNGGLFSTDCAGCSWTYPNASDSERRALVQRHVDYQQGYLWTLANDEAIPKAVRDALNEYGLCADEFTNSILGAHWPEQLYVREARRMIGDAVFTQNDVTAQRAYSASNESAGMGSYNFDAHYSHRGPCLPNKDRNGCTMLTADDPPLTNAEKANSSIVWTGGEGFGGNLDAIYELPYSLLLPKRAEVTNLLCPLTPSVTHVALATVRMEPQFMILGQTAGTAAAICSRNGSATAVHDVDRWVCHV